jgi:long-chain fatty acid transport protein
VKRTLAAALALLLPSTAVAGGLARPNNLSARGVSLGGAFVAVADDATAWHFNPAGTAFAEPAVHLGAELVIAPRTYVPVDAAGNRGPAQKPETPIVPLPALGLAVRVSDRVTVGAGVWNTFGGQLEYCADRAACQAEHATDMLGGVIDNTQNAVIELVTGASYRVDDTLAVGGAMRVGYGLFKVMTTSRPADSKVSASGVGVGASLGATWRPSPAVTVAASWRSGLSVETTGDGLIGDVTVPVEHTQTWPQSASLGAAFAAGPDVTISTQLDWTQWSRYERIVVDFPASTVVQIYPLDWDDSYGLRAGVEWRQSRRLALRGGAYFDSNAIPDYTMERQYLDRNKVGLSYGASLGLGAWRVDVGGDLLGVVGGSPRTVPDNSAEVAGFPALRNVSPGEYSSKLLTFELAVVRRL